jgi:hypothetical protein
VFIHADEPADVRRKHADIRRKKILKSLFERVSREGKVTEILQDGSSLTTDGVIVYTLRDGRLADAAGSNCVNSQSAGHFASC